MIYLASPYSGTVEQQQERYELALKATAKLLAAGQFVYSPIVHCHELTKVYDLPGHHEFWKEYNEHMLGMASDLYVLMIDGWKESLGVSSEIVFAIWQQIPVSYIDG